MNINNFSDFKSAEKAIRIIKLGGSASSLVNMMPEYFDAATEASARAKALRIYNEFAPDIEPSKASRSVTFSRLMSRRSLVRKESTDFAKLIIPDLTQILSKQPITGSGADFFLDTFEAYKESFVGTLDFQQAFSVFRYIESEIVFKKQVSLLRCSKCNKHYLKLFDASTGNTVPCPYCKG